MRQWIEAILRNAQLLQLRLDHLMAAVRNDSSDVQLIELPPLLQESVQLFMKGQPAGQRRIDVQTTCDRDVPPVRVDAGRLMQVLFSSARKRSAGAVESPVEAGKILLRASTAVEDGRRCVTLDVIDNGPGVPEAYINRVFEPFFTTRKEGTGYGLYLAAEILKEQSGRLTGAQQSRAAEPRLQSGFLRTRIRAESQLKSAGLFNVRTPLFF